MKKMAASNVFIAGMGGLGVEIGPPSLFPSTFVFFPHHFLPAKNVALAGVKSLTIQDDVSASFLDLSTQFFLSQASIGKNRAEVSVRRFSSRA